MKISECWLREWVNPPIESKDLVKQLTMAGLEVESVAPVAGVFDHIVVGQVNSVEKHPDADRLRVCKVSIGETELELNIVCGASNVRPGLKVALAMLGAKLPEGLVIKRSKIRGIESEGMLCSAKELQLAEASEGILELPEDASVGQDFRRYLQLDDLSLEINLTPNRGDCLSVQGIAREVAVHNKKPLTSPKLHPIKETITDSKTIVIEREQDCPRYVGRIIKNIHPQAGSPLWLQEKLRRSGLRSIHPVVDVTNYVMLELGQPLHAFDLEKLYGSIHVRFAKEGETLTLLNDQTVELQTNTLIIADEKHPLALAGIMGGKDSAVDSHSTAIFLESAFFTPSVIAGRARSYGLSTDSSHRFERGVDPQLQEIAIERATELLLQIVGGEAGPISNIAYNEYLPNKTVIKLAKDKVSRYLGFSIAPEDISDILVRLGLDLQNVDDNHWQVTVPSYRFDLQADVDLIEEIVRVHGYQMIPNEVPIAQQTTLTSTPEGKVTTDELRDCLVNLGYQEVMSYSFVNASQQQLLDPEHQALALLNPLSADLAVMRTNLWPGLINTVLYNQNRQQNRLRFFEIGTRFVVTANQGLLQESAISGVMTHHAYQEQWGLPKRPLDFYDLKAHVESLLSLSKQRDQFNFISGTHPALHPGQTSVIKFGNDEVGILGALHPKIERELGCIGPVYLFEIKQSVLLDKKLPKYKPISRFPAIRRDLAIIIDKQHSAEAVSKVIAANAGQLLIDLFVFDVYAGQGVPEGKKSMAFALTLQHESRTLVDEEVNQVMVKITQALKQTFEAMLRD